jgi:hypothetical protein
VLYVYKSPSTCHVSKAKSGFWRRDATLTPVIFTNHVLEVSIAIMYSSSTSMRYVWRSRQSKVAEDLGMHVWPVKHASYPMQSHTDGPRCRRNWWAKASTGIPAAGINYSTMYQSYA